MKMKKEKDKDEDIPWRTQIDASVLISRSHDRKDSVG